MAGDASNKASCSYGVSNMNFFLQRKFTEAESKLSSGHRELLTVKHALQYKEAQFKGLEEDKKIILWLTNSANMVTFLTKGSTKPDIQREVLDIFKRLRDMKLTVKPVHVSRNNYRIQLADEGTRYFDPDDWSVDSRSFKRFTVDKTVSLDVFAHSSNKRTERFFSFGKCPGSAGTDAFTQDWSTEDWAWICPPTGLIVDAIKKVLAIRMKAILVIPCWQTATFWPYVCPDGRRLHKAARKLIMARPYIIRGKCCESRLMEGYTNFEFMIVDIVSDGKGYVAESGDISVHRQLDQQ